jgi:hypothetical protein
VTIRRLEASIQAKALSTAALARWLDSFRRRSISSIIDRHHPLQADLARKLLQVLDVQVDLGAGEVLLCKTGRHLESTGYEGSESSLYLSLTRVLQIKLSWRFFPNIIGYSLSQ